LRIFFNFLKVEEKQAAETRGRIKFRLEYDFTLQELRVTVSGNIFFNCSHLNNKTLGPIQMEKEMEKRLSFDQVNPCRILYSVECKINLWIKLKIFFTQSNE